MVGFYSSRSEPSPRLNGDAPFAAARRRMVEKQLRGRDIADARILAVMGHVAREQFVPEGLREESYEDHPLPIGFGQTISQPYIVALMTQLVRPTPESRVLEIGVGSGYQTAVLAELCREVYGVEILRPLADLAARRLDALGYKNAVVRNGDGSEGWPEYSPFDVILAAAATDRIPRPLVEQLAVGGRLAIPIGDESQELVLIEKRGDGSLRREEIIPVRFVRMTGGTAENGA